MILLKTTEYSIRILTFMAKNDQQLNSAKYLHEQLSIPYKYLTSLMTGLVKSGYLISVQGRDGGFKINKKLKEITLAKIIETTQGMDSFDGCVLGFYECSDGNPCAMHFFWQNNKENFLSTIRNTTLEDLCSANTTKY